MAKPVVPASGIIDKTLLNNAAGQCRAFSLLWLCDRIVRPAAIGGALIRMGNFMNSEIVGLPTQRAWGVVFDRVDTLPRHPVQLYEAAAFELIVPLHMGQLLSLSFILAGLFLLLPKAPAGT
ncbi:prolipoprotein diacylglyceryl transferase family protein [uncultured Desulfobacter sp.]|uniref:prolipoprotein diacylglyceryl transferase family protein n=1 Tax=uncultured Desulfobacter sp. TaxID=240139 RepID=UPI002AAA9B94|nr:prolipoprotein diacylglyceryl transferase family protein [uncultured Desulfobacter sp.]